MKKLCDAYCLLRKMFLLTCLIGVGYLLGNAFPTFEVVPYGYKAQKFDPVGLAPFVEMNDFNDEVQ